MILSGDYPPGSRLPSLRNMAHAFSVSFGSISRATDILVAEGLVRKVRGSGLYVRDTQNNDENPGLIADFPPLDKKPKKIYNDIRREISAGNWRVGNVLPPRKELRFRLRTSPSTLGKALRRAAEDGLVHQSGSSWIVGPPDIKTPGKTLSVYALSGGIPSTSNRVARSVTDLFLFPFEKELANFGIPFRANIGPNDPRRPAPGILARGKALGFLFYGYREDWATWRENPLQLVEDEMTWLSRLDTPVAVFNCAPVVGQFPDFSFKPFKNVFPLGLDNLAAGQETGIHLARMGHSRIAFFSYSDDIWNARRLEGLESAQESFPHDLKEIVPFQANVEKTAFRNLQNIDISRLSTHLNEMAKEINPAYKGAADIPWPSITGPIRTMMIGKHQRSILEPLFERARKDRTITAWVASNPPVAIDAARYLRNHGLSVPGDVSLITIDDTKDLPQAGITACNLQVERIAYLAAHCLMGDIPIRRNRKGVVECPVRIVDRGSVAKV